MSRGILSLTCVGVVLSACAFLVAQPGEPTKSDAKKTDAKPTPPEKKDPPKTEDPKKEPAKKDDEKASADELKRWKELLAEHEKIAKRLRELESEFKTASELKKRRILLPEVNELLEKYNKKMRDEMRKLAPKVYAAAPEKHPLAAEFAMKVAFDTDIEWERAAVIGDALLKQGRESYLLLNTMTELAYKLTRFDQAIELAEKLDKYGWMNEGVRTINFDLKTMKTTWEKEKETREKEAVLKDDKRLPQVVFETKDGEILIELFEDSAPNTVANFIALVEAGEYDGIKITLVQSGDSIKTGDPESKKWDGKPKKDKFGKEVPYESSKAPFTIKDEAKRPHLRGVLSMEKPSPTANASREFVFLQSSASYRDKDHTVFGRVLSGMHVVDRFALGDEITKAKVLFKRKHEYKPERESTDPKKKPDDKKTDGKDPMKKTDGKEPAKKSDSKEPAKTDPKKTDGK